MKPGPAGDEHALHVRGKLRFFCRASSLRRRRFQPPIPWPAVRKWWLESVRRRAAEEAHQRLARSNANTAVKIETVDGIERATTGRGRSTSGSSRRRTTLSTAAPWILGRYMFDFLVESGLRPSIVCCDFGCGALRLGVWTIPYLDAGHYIGIDSHLESLEAAAAYEIPLHALEAKRPRCSGARTLRSRISGCSSTGGGFLQLAEGRPPEFARGCSGSSSRPSLRAGGS